MELPKTKLEQLELEHEATLTTVFFHLKSNISMRYDISKATAPAMPNLGKGTECIRLLLSQTSKDMHEPLVPMLFPILGAHVCGAEFQYPDLTWKEPTGMMANLVGDSGCNKGQLSNLVEAICRDFRQHDEAELKKLVEWSKQVKQKASTKEKPARPDVAFYFPPNDTTRPAFLQNAMALEAQGGRTQYLDMPEVEMADGLCGSHRQVSQMLRNIYDRKRAGALRATADGVTGNPILRANLTLSATPFAARKYYKNDLFNGTFGRMVFSYKARQSRDGRIPRQGKYTEEFYQKLDEYLARLDITKGRFIIRPLNKLADKLAQDMNFHVSRATLYNTLNLFMALRLVIRHRFQGSTKYEACYDNNSHCHQICTMCGKVTEVKSSEIITAVENMPTKRFRKDGFTLYVYGVCSTCQARVTKRKKQEKTIKTNK